MVDLSASAIEHMAPFVQYLDQLRIVQRVTGLVVTPEPNAVRIDFDTNLPSAPIIEVYRLTVASDGALVFSPSNLLGIGWDFLNPALGQPKNEHHARIAKLPQATDCMYRIIATGGDRPSPLIVTGRFRTGVRHATMTVRDIRMWNDGDGGLGASGEFDFLYGLYTADDDRGPQRHLHRNIGAGDLVDLPFGTAPALSMPNAGDYVSTYVAGREQDRDFWSSFLPALEAPLYLPTHPRDFETDDEAFADAMQTHTLPRENGERRLPVHLDSGAHSIHYETTGWLTVNVSNPPPLRPVLFTDPKRKVALLPGRVSAAVAAIGGGKTAFALSAAGALYTRPARARRGDRAWDEFAGIRADAAAVIPAPDDRVVVVALARGILTETVYRASNLETDATQNVLATGLGDELRVAISESSAAVLAAPDSEGRAKLILLDPREAGVRETILDLGGRFDGPLSVAVGDDDTAWVVGVTAEGHAEGARVSLSRSIGDEPAWSALGDERISLIFLSRPDEGEPTELLALTPDYRVLRRVLGQADFGSRWVDLGSLDDFPLTLIPAEEPQEPPPSTSPAES
jgi:hypothetical protein